MSLFPTLDQAVRLNVIRRRRWLQPLTTRRTTTIMTTTTTTPTVTAPWKLSLSTHSQHPILPAFLKIQAGLNLPQYHPPTILKMLIMTILPRAHHLSLPPQLSRITSAIQMASSLLFIQLLHPFI